MRVVKDFDERRSEIIEAADRLFLEEGYDKCTVNAIINSVGIAKGTFYHYFKSKEEVLDAVIDMHMIRLKDRIQLGLEKYEDDLKLLHVMLSMNMTDQIGADAIGQLHAPENVKYHQKLMTATIAEVAPLMSAVIAEGNGHAWQCAHPMETAQIFLAAALTLTDQEMHGPLVDQEVMIKVLVETFEKMLNVAHGRFLKLL